MHLQQQSLVKNTQTCSTCNQCTIAASVSGLVWGCSITAVAQRVCCCLACLNRSGSLMVLLIAQLLCCRSQFHCGPLCTYRWWSQSQLPSSHQRDGYTASCTYCLRMPWALSRWAQSLLVRMQTTLLWPRFALFNSNSLAHSSVVCLPALLQMLQSRSHVFQLCSLLQLLCCLCQCYAMFLTEI